MRNIKPKKDEYMFASTSGSKKKESRDIYPSFSIDLEHIPEAKEWKVGDTYHIEMEVKMTGLSQSRFQNSAEFEIRKIETDEGEKEDEDDQSNE